MRGGGDGAWIDGVHGSDGLCRGTGMHCARPKSRGPVVSCASCYHKNLGVKETLKYHAYARGHYNPTLDVVLQPLLDILVNLSPVR